MINKSLYTSTKQDWETPDDLFEKLNREFNFSVDLAASNDNKKGRNYIDDIEMYTQLKRLPSLLTSAYCNPPYNKIKLFVTCCLELIKNTHRTIVMLVPARTDTKWFSMLWDYEKHTPQPGIEIRFLKGRLKFKGAKYSAPFPSMLVILRKDKMGSE